jgi:hypothetical protein
MRLGRPGWSRSRRALEGSRGANAAGGDEGAGLRRAGPCCAGQKSSDVRHRSAPARPAGSKRPGGLARTLAAHLPNVAAAALSLGGNHGGLRHGRRE